MTWQKAEFTPSLSRKDWAEISFCREGRQLNKWKWAETWYLEEMAVLPEHVEVNIRSPEILFVGLMHRGVTFCAQISTVNPKTLCHPFKSGLILLKYKSKNGRFSSKSERDFPLPGMRSYGKGKVSEQKHTSECITLQLVLHKIAYESSKAFSAWIWKQKPGKIIKSTRQWGYLHGEGHGVKCECTSAASHLQLAGLMSRALPFPSWVWRPSWLPLPLGRYFWKKARHTAEGSNSWSDSSWAFRCHLKTLQHVQPT